MDAVYANPNVYHYLEAEGYFYAVRLIGNPILHNKIEHLMTRPVGRPPPKPIVLYHSFQYQVASWDKSRRVVAEVIRYSRYVTFQLAAVLVSKRLFEEILEGIHRLKLLPIGYG